MALAFSIRIQLGINRRTAIFLCNSNVRIKINSQPIMFYYSPGKTDKFLNDKHALISKLAGLSWYCDRLGFRYKHII